MQSSLILKTRLIQTRTSRIGAGRLFHKLIQNRSSNSFSFTKPYACVLRHLYSLHSKSVFFSLQGKMASISKTEDQRNFPNSPFGENGLDFLEKIVDVIIKDVLIDGCNGANKVVEFVQPQVLEDLIDVGLEESRDADSLISICKDIVRYSVKTGHPLFLNQLYQGVDIHGLGGAWLTESLNTNQFTHEVAPVFLLLERILLEKIRHLVGYPVKEEDGGDGIFCPGGSISNMYALSLARFQKFPSSKQKGLRSLPELRVFTSEHSHYSIKKGMFFMGFGMESLVAVACDDRGRMDAHALEDAILKCVKDGATPVMVNATCGTTVYGAYDPLDDIADVCKRHQVWMHVDACWGGGALVTDKYKYLMQGIEKSDSMAWCFHKMLGSPLQCCPFVTRHKGLLRECHSLGASYLFQRDKNYDIRFDIGDKSIQCGRKVDALKMWIIWKAKGDAGLGAETEAAFSLAEYFHGRMSAEPGFRPVYGGGPQCTNVCFWYIPRRLRNSEDTESDAWWAEVGRVAPHVKRRMMERGSMLIGYQPLKEKTNFFRLVLTRMPYRNEEHMDKIVKEIALLGEENF